jgi:hypothetical protein
LHFASELRGSSTQVLEKMRLPKSCRSRDYSSVKTKNSTEVAGRHCDPRIPSGIGNIDVPRLAVEDSVGRGEFQFHRPYAIFLFIALSCYCGGRHIGPVKLETRPQRVGVSPYTLVRFDPKTGLVDPRLAAGPPYRPGASLRGPARLSLKVALSPLRA